MAELAGWLVAQGVGPLAYARRRDGWPELAIRLRGMPLQFDGLGWTPVRPGYGERALQEEARPDVVVADLGEVAEWILRRIP